MEHITPTVVNTAIQTFLTEQLAKKSEPERKALEKATAINDAEAINKARESLSLLEQKYALDSWMDDAANRMAKQLKFGTHISRGINPYSKGDNVNLTQAQPLAETLVGTHSVGNPELDANGNAAALPLASFFNISVGEYRLRELIQAEHPSVTGCFARDSATSADYAKRFKAALDNPLTQPVTSELNKQLLWPMDGADAVDTDDYRCLIPLYPSALTHQLHKTVQAMRYSEENKQAQANRKKKTAEQAPYLTFHQLAYATLGGSNAQNVGILNTRQGGRNYLLPSLPPQFNNDRGYRLSKGQKTLFDKALQYRCRRQFNELRRVLEAPKNTVDVRTLRKDTLDAMLFSILNEASAIQRRQAPGWSRDYGLCWPEKYWLDPLRGELEGEEEFKTQREQTDWHRQIARAFSEWLQQILKNQFPTLADEFSDAEMREWRKEMREAIKASRRNGEGIF